MTVVAESTESTASQRDELLRRLQAYIGVGEDRAGFSARGPVSARVVRQMTDALGDLNRIYVDDAAARAAGHDGIVAPPTMLHAWTLPGLEASEGQEMLDEQGVRRFRQMPYGERVKAIERRTLRDEVNDVLAEYGYTSPAVTNMWFEYHRYLAPGDQLHFSSWIVEEIAGPKQTSLGEGFFTTIRLTVTDGSGHVVGTMRQTHLRSLPKAGPADAPKPKSPPPAEPREGRAATSTAWTPILPQPTLASPASASLTIGGQLPALVVDITPTLIIAGALGSQDFQDVHHDTAAAQRRGHPDIYMNILTSTGLAGRFITDWAGPRALVRSLSIRLGRPNYPGDQMRMAGEIVAVEERGGYRRVRVKVVGTNRLGAHLTSEVAVDVPVSGG